MFCKWCGKTIKTTDERCPECGRETPAMSDCGGLYNLKHSAAASTPIVPMPAKCPLVDRLEARYEKDRRAAKKHHTAMLASYAANAVVLLALLVVVVTLTIQIGELEDKIDFLQETSVAQDTEPATDPNPSDTTNPSEGTDPSDATIPTETTLPADITNPTEVPDSTDATEPTEKEDNASQ